MGPLATRVHHPPRSGSPPARRSREMSVPCGHTCRLWVSHIPTSRPGPGFDYVAFVTNVLCSLAASCAVPSPRRCARKRRHYRRWRWRRGPMATSPGWSITPTEDPTSSRSSIQTESSASARHPRPDPAPTPWPTPLTDSARRCWSDAADPGGPSSRSSSRPWNG